MYKLKPKVESNPYKVKIRKRIIILIVSLVILGVTIVYIVNPKEDVIPVSYPVCDYNQDKIIEEFKNYKFDDKLAIEDYFYYGETLSLFENKYDISQRDELLGKTIVLENICTKQEYFYLIDQDVDGQIPVSQLPPGMYEVFINDNFLKKRVVAKEKIFDSINLTRNKTVSNNVELVGTRNIFDDKNHMDYLNDDYLFLSVKENKKDVADYDIVIDPQQGNNPSGWFDNMGVEVDGLIEADENYDMAILIKNELEKSGLKVLITRDSKDHIINMYGDQGRLHKAYNSKAKYYIEIGWANTEMGGLKVYNSAFSSAQFAGNIANYLLLETNLETLNSEGVFQHRLYNGLDGSMTIREIGGKALAAATVSETAVEQNSSFAFNNPHGQEALYIEYISYKNQAEVSAWKDNKQTWAAETANAIIAYLDIGEIDDLSN